MDVVDEATKAVGSWHLGQTSTRYETGGRGAGTISSGQGDHGGVSYGSYQFATNTGGVREYLDQSKYGPQFSGLTPATEAFNEKWKQLAQEDAGFGADQHDFIKKQYYTVQQDALNDRGIDLGDRGRAVQDALWSTSVQYRTLTPGIFEKGLQEKFGQDFKLSDLSDEQIVGAVQDYKADHVQTLFKSSPKLWDSLTERAQSEKASLVTLARYEDVVLHPDQNKDKSYQQIYGESPYQPGARVARDPMADGVVKSGEQGDAVKAMQEKLGALGYAGADGKPLVADSDFGKNTRAAVEQFQRDHGLEVDGKAGKHTFEALDAATAARTQGQATPPAASPAQANAAPVSAPTMADAAHPDHARYGQALEKLQGLEAQRAQAGLAPVFGSERELQNAAGQVAFETKVAGMPQVDAIVARPDGAGVFAVSGTLGDPAAQRVYVDRAQAENQSVEASTQQLGDLNRQFPAEQTPPVQAQAQGVAR
jgi:peptidoglycan hydrolase-like protein with peptidoglycan-binding domain